MGMFDSFYTADGVEWQTKAYGCALDTWRIGDTVPSQPASAYQVEIFGGHRSEKVRWSTATVRDDHLVSIDDPREPALPLVGYGGGVTEMPTLTETRTEWRVLTRHASGIVTESGVFHARESAQRCAELRPDRASWLQQRTVTEWVDA